MLAQGALVQFALVDYNAGTFVTPTFINGWFMPLSDPIVRIKPGLTPSQQLFLSTVPLRATVSFGWFEPLTDPIRFPPALKTGLQQFLAPSPNPLVSFGWMAALSEPRIKTKPMLRASQQQAFIAPPTISPIVSFSWFRGLSEPTVKTKLGLRASQQQFLARQELPLTGALITGTMNLFERGDTMLFAGRFFGRPVNALIGVIELAQVPYLGIIEMPLTQGVRGVIEDAAAPASGSAVPVITSAAVSIRII